MMRQWILGAAFVSMAGVAQAQTTPALVEADDATTVEAFNLTVDQVEDLDLIGADGERIGEVDDVLMTPEGEITAVSADVGGFLGLGEKDVMIEIDQLTPGENGLVTNLTKEQLEQLPDWDD
ncbi:PRC-barrel domain-containing protein [Geminicoccus roseus]|uniref:PRC-barrel domain-containing protein n=1 Tax=Geminicoccus roseus TaxID=404900 RepID=UPI0004266DE9|nr:PRC-barrel domain-containing protein [Geminicoccus roseus]